MDQHLSLPLSRRSAVGWLAALALPQAWARKQAGAPLLMTAREAPTGIDPAGWLVSEKLDGVRGLWDGGALVFRSGLPIAAPAWFTHRLPSGVRLDGELWLARGQFEAVSGVVRKAVPVDAEWRAVRYQLFDTASN